MKSAHTQSSRNASVSPSTADLQARWSGQTHAQLPNVQASRLSVPGTGWGCRTPLGKALTHEWAGKVRNRILTVYQSPANCHGSRDWSLLATLLLALKQHSSEWSGAFGSKTQSHWQRKKNLERDAPDRGIWIQSRMRRDDGAELEARSVAGSGGKRAQG